MPLHAHAAAFLEGQRRPGVVPDHLLSVAQAREKADQPPDPDRVEPVAHLVDVAVPGSAGPVAARVYRPAGRPLGVVLYLHGGGHVTGTADSYDRLTRRLANRVPPPWSPWTTGGRLSTAARRRSTTPRLPTTGSPPASRNWRPTAAAGSSSPVTAPAATTRPSSPAGCATPGPRCQPCRSSSTRRSTRSPTATRTAIPATATAAKGSA